jgi:hypothetical protein
MSGIITIMMGVNEILPINEQNLGIQLIFVTREKISPLFSSSLKFIYYI